VQGSSFEIKIMVAGQTSPQSLQQIGFAFRLLLLAVTLQEAAIPFAWFGTCKPFVLPQMRQGSFFKVNNALSLYRMLLFCFLNSVVKDGSWRGGMG
jgi:hypothetical protein